MGAQREETPGGAPGGVARGGAKGQAARAKRRRWLRRLAVALAGLIVLVLVLPYLAATGPATRLIVSYVNSRIEGRIRIEDLSLSWFGPCKVRGLEVDDAAGAEVLRAEDITLAGGVWGAIFSLEAFDSIQIKSPRVRLRFMQDGGVSLAGAFRPRGAQPEAPPGPLPKPRGKIVFDGGTLRLERGDGQAYELTQIEGQLELDTLDRISGQVSLAPAGGGRLRAEAAINALAAGGSISAETAAGTVKIITDSDFDLGPLAAFGLGEPGVEGRAGVEAQLDLRSGQASGQFQSRLTNLRAPHPGGAQARGIDLQLTGGFDRTPERVRARAALAGQAGEFQTELSYARPSPRPADKTAWGDVLAALLEGEPVALPDFALSAKGWMDVPAVGSAVPALLKIRPDVEITGGRLGLEDVAIRGGGEPLAKGKIELAGLTATRGGPGGSSIAWAPIVAELHAVVTDQGGAEVKYVRLRLSEATNLHAAGPLGGLRGGFAADLTALHQQIAQVFDLGSLQLAGTADGTFELAWRRGKGPPQPAAGSDESRRLDFKLDAAGKKLQYVADGRRLEVARAVVNHRGYVTFTRGGLGKLGVTDGQTEIEGVLAASGSGWFDLPTQAFDARAAVKKADLGRLRELLAGVLSLGDLEPAGTIRIAQASFARSSADGPVVSSGSGSMEDVAFNGEPWTKAGTFQWSDVRFAPSEQLFAATAAGVDTPALTFSAKDVRGRFGRDLSLGGEVARLSADLKRCLAVASRLGRWDRTPPVSGVMHWSGRAATAGQVTTFAGSGRIENFRVGAGEAMPQEEVTFAQDGNVDWRADTLTLGNLEVNSKPLFARLAGEVRQFRTTRELNLTGRYRASWEYLMPILRELAPGLGEQIALSGETQSAFKVTGPARRAEVRPAFRGVDAGLEVGWASGRAYGLTLGKAMLSPTLRDGQLSVPVTTIPSGEGKVRAGGLVDLRSGAAVLHMPGETRALEDVALNAELGKHLLGRINPVFSELDVGQLSGKVSLAVTDLTLPLAGESLHAAVGKGRLDLADVKILPRGILATLLSLGGLGAEKPQSVKISGVDFAIKKGRIHYDNFAMSFADGLDLNFHGSVGLDDSLDLAVSVPVRSALLRRLGVRGPVADYARLLEGARVDVPMAGTRRGPRLNLSRVDVGPLIQRAVRALLAEQATGRLGDVLAPKKPTTQASQPATRPGPKEPSKKPQEQLLDSIFDLINRPKRD